MKFSLLASILLISAHALCLSARAAGRAETSLGGEWSFTLDPVNAGVEQEWFKPGLSLDRWDKVLVPHCFSADPRYRNFTGSAWYLRKFVRPSSATNTRTFLHFDAAYYRTQVWLNGQLIGEHEGGYTPFEFDVTGLLTEENLLAVRVNNSWDTTTIPGAKTKVDYQSLNVGQLFPWMNYGGITRDVSLITRPELYVDKVKIEATPDLNAGTARIGIAAFVRNRSSQPWKGNDLALVVTRRGEKIPVKVQIADQVVGPQTDAMVRIEATLAKEQVRLWSLDAPELYEAELTAGEDRVRTAFGIRSIEVRGTKLLLNGEPIALGGANRPLDVPGYGSTEPREILEKDLTMMKAAGMVLSRIAHYPVSTALLDWADRHGMLIITEAGNWQMTPAQMANPAMRAKFQSQMREMVERDWNHPSVIAVSVGNEYQSQTDEGKAWTKDMIAFAKSLDATRLVTFAGYMVHRPAVKRAEDDGSQFVDFISVNIYENHLEALRKVHALYPDKAVYVSEFGQRADLVKSESERVDYLRAAMEAFRQCDFVIGASVWTFNDYESMFPGSNANGYRPWGLVTPERAPREMYHAWQKEFAPAVVTVRPAGSGEVEITVAARNDFPRQTLRNHQLKVSGRVLEIPLLAPGERKTFHVSSAPGSSDRTVELIAPGGYVILRSSF